MSYKIWITEDFKRSLKKCDYSIKEQIKKEIEQLKENPFVGKPLIYNFFKEKKVGSYRFYYLVYEKYVVVFIITLSKKKRPTKGN